MDVVVVVVFSIYRYSSTNTNTPTFRDWLIYESTFAFNLLYPYDVTNLKFYGTDSNVVSHTSCHDDCSTEYRLSSQSVNPKSACHNLDDVALNTETQGYCFQ